MQKSTDIKEFTHHPSSNARQSQQIFLLSYREDWSKASDSSMVAKRLEEGGEVIQLGLRDFFTRKCRHSPEPISDLRANGKGRQWFIESRTKSGLSAWMVRMTMLHKHLLPFDDSTVHLVTAEAGQLTE